MREIEKVGVIGAGLMGHALAIVHALGGCNVIMQDLKAVSYTHLTLPTIVRV